MHAEIVARKARDLAEAANRSGTFGVGGLLIDQRGGILHEVSNRVLVDGRINDPTAHGERQLVDWYFRHRDDRQRLPEPERLTIVSSLDPCAMCAGAILTAGFNVAVVANDDFAGINYNLHADFPSLPDGLLERAKCHFAYLRVVDGDRIVREYSGSNTSMFADDAVSDEVCSGCWKAFSESLEKTKDLISEAAQPDQLTDPATLPEDSPVRAVLRRFDDFALRVKIHLDDEVDTLRLAEILVDTALAAGCSGNANDAAALIDPFNNLLLCTSGLESVSPIQTRFMRLTQHYAQARRTAGQLGSKTLAHPKWCRVVTLNGPADDAASLMELGAYGSTIEGPLPTDNRDSFLYMIPRLPQHETQKVVARMPPFYKHVGFDVRPVGHPKVLAYCRERLGS